MDRLQHYVEHALSLTGTLDVSAGQVVEVRNNSTGAGNNVEVDGEELVSLLALVLTDGLHQGLTAWDVLEQLLRLPESADVFLAPKSSIAFTSNRALHDGPTDVDDLTNVGELARVLSVIAPKSPAGGFGTDDSAAVGGRRATHGISTKFLRSLATMARKFSPTAPGPVRARVFLRCALNMRSLTAAVEALCCLPQIGPALYDDGGLLRCPQSVRTLLEVIAPIGGPNLRVRAAASLFDVTNEQLLSKGLSVDSITHIISSSGAALAAEKASRSATPDNHDGVALLCATVAEARDVLRQYPISAAYVTVPTMKFALELSLPSDEELDQTSDFAPRRRAGTVMHTQDAGDKPDDSSVIVVQRRKRAATIIKGGATSPASAGKPRPKAKRAAGADVPSPALSGDRMSPSTQGLGSPEPSGAFSDTRSGVLAQASQPAFAALSPVSPSPSPSLQGLHGGLALGESRQPARLVPVSAAPPPVPSAPGSPLITSSQTSDALNHTARSTSSASLLCTSMPAAVASTTSQMKEALNFEHDEMKALEDAAAARDVLLPRIQDLRNFVAKRAERARQQSANVEPLVAAYEAAVRRMWTQALVTAAAKEGELMEFHDMDAPPPPVDDDASESGPLVPPSGK
jgi:hypothetical protein